MRGEAATQPCHSSAAPKTLKRTSERTSGATPTHPVVAKASALARLFFGSSADAEVGLSALRHCWASSDSRERPDERFRRREVEDAKRRRTTQPDTGPGTNQHGSVHLAFSGFFDRLHSSLLQLTASSCPQELCSSPSYAPGPRHISSSSSPFGDVVVSSSCLKRFLLRPCLRHRKRFFLFFPDAVCEHPSLVRRLALSFAGSFPFCVF